jgi:DNA-binding MarR family transcriptional regulator
VVYGDAGLRASPVDAEGTRARRRYRARWHAFRDLLESKRQAIRGRQSGRAKQLLHAGPILEALASGAKRQSELQTALGLSAQRLSQVLSVMEEAGLIERERHGKQKIVTLASSSEMHVPIPACRRVGPMIFGIRPSRVARSATRSW